MKPVNRRTRKVEKVVATAENTPISSVVSVRITNILEKAEVLFVSQLFEKEPSALLEIKNLGVRSLKEVLSKIEEAGISIPVNWLTKFKTQAKIPERKK